MRIKIKKYMLNWKETKTSINKKNEQNIKLREWGLELKSKNKKEQCCTLPIKREKRREGNQKSTVTIQATRHLIWKRIWCRI
jgi:AAA15 family ATPase/GTPase